MITISLVHASNDKTRKILQVKKIYAPILLYAEHYEKEKNFISHPLDKAVR
jgi:hypothetical protein